MSKIERFTADHARAIATVDVLQMPAYKSAIDQIKRAAGHGAPNCTVELRHCDRTTANLVRDALIEDKFYCTAVDSCVAGEYSDDGRTYVVSSFTVHW